MQKANCCAIAREIYTRKEDTFSSIISFRKILLSWAGYFSIVTFFVFGFSWGILILHRESYFYLDPAIMTLNRNNECNLKLLINLFILCKSKSTGRGDCEIQYG